MAYVINIKHASGLAGAVPALIATRSGAIPSGWERTVTARPQYLAYL